MYETIINVKASSLWYGIKLPDGITVKPGCIASTPSGGVLIVLIVNDDDIQISVIQGQVNITKLQAKDLEFNAKYPERRFA